MFGLIRSRDKFPAGVLDNRLIAATRLILAISAVLILDYTSMPRIKSDATRLVLMLYIVYSAALYFLTARRIRQKKPTATWPNRTDLVWYALFVGLSGGTQSIFFFGFFFAILVASFEWGFISGLITTAAAGLLFIGVAVAVGDEGPVFELQRFLVRLLYLCVLGYLMAHWGGQKVTLIRRLKL